MVKREKNQRGLRSLPQLNILGCTSRLTSPQRWKGSCQLEDIVEFLWLFEPVLNSPACASHPHHHLNSPRLHYHEPFPPTKPDACAIITLHS